MEENKFTEEDNSIEKENFIIEKKSIMKFLFAIGVILFIIAFLVLIPTFDSKVKAVAKGFSAINSQTSQAETNVFIYIKKGFELKNANITITIKTKSGDVSKTYQTTSVRSYQTFNGVNDIIGLEVKINSYNVSGHAKYVVPALILFILSLAAMSYSVYYLKIRKNE